MKVGSPEYKEKLWEFFKQRGGVPKDYGGIAAQGWYLEQENFFRMKLENEGIKLEPADPTPKQSGNFKF